QNAVTIHVLQGEREISSGNKSLGQFNLADIPPAPRGMPQIEVTFDIDANGILNVSAKDKATGKSHNIRIEAKSGLSQEEIDRMKREAEANADSDKKAKEEVDKLNEADAMIFQTEKQLKEFGDKIPAEKKAPIENALTELKAAHASKDVEKVTAALASINTLWTAASEDMYKAQQNAGANDQQNNAGPNNNGAQNEANKNGGENVTDVDFEEVK
ncbi:MAG: Hsp70 family protein, partial [Bacteroidota bacterium]|nr:Hsp70 family protein [Bacteroidota bacterium]